MRLERRIEASRRHHERFPTAQKTRPHLPFVLFSRSTRALFSSTTPVPDRTNAPAQDGTGPNRSQQVHLARIPLLRCFLPVPLLPPPPSRRSDFRETVIFSGNRSVGVFVFGTRFLARLPLRILFSSLWKFLRFNELTVKSNGCIEEKDVRIELT